MQGYTKFQRASTYISPPTSHSNITWKTSKAKSHVAAGPELSLIDVNILGRLASIYKANFVASFSNWISTLKDSNL